MELFLILTRVSFGKDVCQHLKPSLSKIKREDMMTIQPDSKCSVHYFESSPHPNLKHSPPLGGLLGLVEHLLDRQIDLSEQQDVVLKEAMSDCGLKVTYSPHTDQRVYSLLCFSLEP